jgi:2-polyprenyl-3-methyl-5-hydroxy-6-metoxy-1,4-benzoquinol methylase
LSHSFSPSQARNAQASFRDPAGHLLLLPGRALRIINRQGAVELKNFLTTKTAREFVAAGRLVGTKFLATGDNLEQLASADLEVSLRADDGATIVEHEHIAMRSFPYEWPPEMLHAAGALMLDLADSALAEGYALKDATPYNVLFRGARPVFVDLLSFEPRDPHDPTWLPFNQFTRTILLPLLVNKYFARRMAHLLIVNRDGVDPEEVYRMCGPLRRLRAPFLTLVSLPYWLSRRQPKHEELLYQPKRLHDPAQAHFILRQQFKRLRRQLNRLTPAAGNGSGWSDYMTPNKFFTAGYLRAKENFVARALAEFKPQRILDVGCNTGHFSRLAARTGARVVAIDQDPAVVGTLWRNAARDDLDILPLVVNLARPTPATGWCNEECPSFLARAHGAFDALLMLAVVHHMLVAEQIPLARVMRLAAELTTGILIIEFVPPDDPLFHRLVRGREVLYEGLTRELFETTARRWFELVRAERLPETNRWLYLLRRRREAD